MTVTLNDLHTKYRPSTFDDVVGQDAVVASLKKVLAKDTSHAFIFTGPSGTGKTTLARIIAHEVGCTKQNLVEVDAATHTGVEAMREVTSTLIYSGLGQTATKVVIIDEAHMLSPAAWNSMLKHIEEPPAHVYWCICTTNPGKIPATIKTRCNSYDLSEVGKDELVSLLERVRQEEELETDDEILDLIAKKAEGSPRRALTALSQVAHCSARKEAAAILKDFGEEPEIIALCRALSKGVSWKEAMELLRNIKEHPEGIRIVVCNYFQKVALSGANPEMCCNILSAFGEPYPIGVTGPYPVILSLAQVLLEHEEKSA